jgi:hypothetical protein
MTNMWWQGERMILFLNVGGRPITKIVCAESVPHSPHRRPATHEIEAAP